MIVLMMNYKIAQELSPENFKRRFGALHWTFCPRQNHLFDFWEAIKKLLDTFGLALW